MERQAWFNLWYVIFAILGVLWLRDIYVTATQVKAIAGARSIDRALAPFAEARLPLSQTSADTLPA
jgi:hypothetical protein